jgi:hypothetical protein
MYRRLVNLPDEMKFIIQHASLVLGVHRGQAVSQNTVIVELIQRGLASVAQEPGWKDAIESTKGGHPK